ncbi:MAG: ubiquinol-cytochrome c reductase iron-sulfur subunit [Nitrospiraceae bacterium]|nr:ubiquinol-cytochrome c reductase iron-sulfur subunit [Nitrospiraceae bacterium]
MEIEGRGKGEMTRRGFFRKVVIGALSGAVGIIVSIPVIRLVINARPPGRLAWSRVGDITSLPHESPVAMNFEMRSAQAYMHQLILRDVWVIRHAGGNVTVFSPICPHLGCHYKWDPATGHFECPCHGSVFTVNGKVIGGPAPRPLDTLPHKIENGALYVQWERFRVGIPQKVRI